MIIKDLEKRGLVKDFVNKEGLENFLKADNKLVLYCGFDPTADSLHVGSLLPLMNLKRFADDGHKVIALVGGATGFIGDPSFKANERKLNSEDTILKYKKGITKQIKNIVGDNAIIVDNLEWTKNISVIDFMRDVGKHFSVNAMMGKESVKQRISRDGEGMSFTEFSYQLLQANDFLVLNDEYGCNFQIGGSDQMGNITSGISLIHKKKGSDKDVFAMTTELLMKSNGEKFGKSETGTIWLDPVKTSPFDFYQFWLKTSNDDVIKFMKFFSAKKPEEIDKIFNEIGFYGMAKLLADEVTEFVHGKESLEQVKKLSEILVTGDPSGLVLNEIGIIEEQINNTFNINDNILLVDALLELNLATSKKMAREFITNGAVKVNGLKILDVNHIVKELPFSIIKRGKRNMGLLKFKK